METHHEQETESYTIPACSLSQEEIESDRKNDAELGLVDLTINELWESFRRDSSIEADFEYPKNVAYPEIKKNTHIHT